MTGEPMRSPEIEQRPCEDDRQGFALAGALLALVVVGALVTGSFFAASQEQAIGISAKNNDAALYVAEYGLNKAVASVPKSVLDTLTATKVLTYTVSGSAQGTDTVWIRPFGDLKFIVSKGVASGGDRRYSGGTRVLGMFVRTFVVSFNDSTAMTIQRGLTVQGSALVSGRDTTPSGSQWSGCANRGLQDAVATPNPALVTTIPAHDTTKIAGAVIRDTTINTNTFNDFGDVTYSTLAALANITYTGDWHPNPNPDGTATTCNTANTQNWGEPMSAIVGCQDYFPIIHVTGDLQITANGRGQGILLVDGHIDIQGAFQFWGVVITKRYIKTYGNGGHINGTVMAADSAALDNNVTTGNSVVQLSSCAVQRASQAAGTNQALPIRNHAWVDLTSAGAGF